MPRIQSVPINGPLIAFLRDKKGITQTELAHKADVSLRLIGLIERKESRTSRKNVEAIAQALGAPESLIKDLAVTESKFDALWEVFNQPPVERTDYPIPFSIYFEGDLSAIPKEKQLLFAEHIKRLFGFLGDAVVLRIRKGSVVITLSAYLPVFSNVLRAYSFPDPQCIRFDKLTFPDFPDAARCVLWALSHNGDTLQLDWGPFLDFVPTVLSSSPNLAQIKYPSYYFYGSESDSELPPFWMIRIFLDTDELGGRRWTLMYPSSEDSTAFFEAKVANFVGSDNERVDNSAP